MCCFYDLEKINPESFFLIKISELKDRTRLLGQAMEMFSDRPFHLAPLGSMETLESHPAVERDATISQMPDLCIPMGLHTWDSFFSPLWSKCLLQAQCLLHVCLPSPRLLHLFQMIPCLHEFQTPTEQAGFNPQTRFQLVTAEGFMRSHVWRQEENIG